MHIATAADDVAIVHNGSLTVIGIKCIQIITHVWRTFALNVYVLPVPVSQAAWISSQ